MHSRGLTRRVRSPWLVVTGLSLLAFGACDTDPPTEVQHPTADPATLATSTLLSGGEGVLVSAAFEGLELRPAVDDEGVPIPERWTNLRVSVDGEQVASRRLGPDRVGFDVPRLLGGTHAVDVTASGATASLSTRVLGALSFDRPNLDEGCALFDQVALVRVGHELVFHTRCDFFVPGAPSFRQGYAAVAPPIAGKGLRWLPGLFFDDEVPVDQVEDRVHAGPSIREGHVVVKQGSEAGLPEMAVWRSGADPQFVAPLSCFGGPPERPFHLATVAEVAPGVCLAVHSGTVWRNGVVVAEFEPSFVAHPIVMAADGWSALRGTPGLVVFDATGELAFPGEPAASARVQDVAFGDDGRLFVTTEGDTGSILEVVDRATGERLIGTEIAGELLALRSVGDRLWAIRRQQVPDDDAWLLVDVYDPASLVRERSVAVSPVYYGPFLAWLLGPEPVLHADVTGTRAYLVGAGRVTGLFLQIFVYTVEVF